MAKSLGEAVLHWLDRAPHLTVESENETLTADAFKSAVLKRRSELREHRAGERVLNSSGRGLAYWIDTVALWLNDSISVPCSPTPSDALRAAVDKVIRRPSEGEAAVWFTSGSTGTPKGALLSAEGLLANATASAERLGLEEGSRLFVPIPYTFVSSLSHFLVALESGASFLGHERSYFPGAFLREVERLGADSLGASPLPLRWALESSRPWRWLMSSGDRLSPETARAVRYRHPKARLNIVYGMTELSGRGFINGGDTVNGTEDSVGLPLDGLKARVDEETNEIQFSGAPVMLGYDGRGREGFTADGWLKSGDTGVMDELGRLRLSGRLDDIFKCAGNKVSLLVIADALWRTGDFADLAVVAKEHPTLGHVPHAYVVPLHPNWSIGDTLGKLRGELPPDHIPHGFSKEESIPRTGSGKLHRPSLAGPK